MKLRDFRISVKWLLPPGHPDRVGNLDTPSMVSMAIRTRRSERAAWGSWRAHKTPLAATEIVCYSKVERDEAVNELYRLQLVEMANDNLDDPEASTEAIMAEVLRMHELPRKAIEHLRLPGASDVELDEAVNLFKQGVRVPGLLTAKHELKDDGSLKDPTKQPAAADDGLEGLE